MTGKRRIHRNECPPLCPSAVHGSPQAAPDASEAPAGPGVPAPRPPQEGSPLHLHPGALPGAALDPQVHGGRHRVPRHGERPIAAWDRLPRVAGIPSV